MPAWAVWLLVLVVAVLFAGSALFAYQDHPQSAAWLAELIASQVWAVGAIIVGRTGQ